MEFLLWACTEFTAKKFVRKKMPYAKAVLLYAFLGAFCGGISLLIMPYLLSDKAIKKIIILIFRPKFLSAELSLANMKQCL